MTVYHTGRSTDYIVGPEERQSKAKPRPLNYTADAIDQFERMSRGYVPRCVAGAEIVWVQDDTITDEQREWCWQTARQIEREAELASRPRPKPKQGIGSRGLNHTKADIERLVARVLARYPDAGVNQIVVVTGLQRPSVIKSEAWQMAQMGRTVKHE